MRDVSAEEPETWDCGECDGERQWQRNCDGNGNQKYLIMLSYQSFTRCPLSSITHLSHHLIRVSSLCRRFSILPCAGSLEEQPGIFLDALDLIDQERDKILAWREKERGNGVKDDK